MESTATYQPLSPHPQKDGPLVTKYLTLLKSAEVTWAARSCDLRVLGRGGQGVVLLARRNGADGFSLPVALKVFSPESYTSGEAYDEDMGRVAAVAKKAATVQHENLVYVYDFESLDGVRVMSMEWVDGHDLRELLTPDTLDRTRRRLDPEHWDYVTDVVITAGPVQPRFKPGVAIQVVRDCLAALAALHRDGVVHGDLKPANIMLKRTGSAKVVDIGSAVDLKRAGGRRVWSPLYAAPEVLDGEPVTAKSDLASLGYVLVEMLSGRPAFDGVASFDDLREMKRTLERRLPDLLPADVVQDEQLVGLCRRLVAADPAKRFKDALAADLERRGAAAFHRRLVKGDLASEYGNDIRVWLERLGPGTASPSPPAGSRPNG